MNIDPKIIVALAKEVEKTDPIDWGYLTISEDNAFELIAYSLTDMYQTYSGPEQQYIILASFCRTLVENMVLNIKLNLKYESLKNDQ